MMSDSGSCSKVRSGNISSRTKPSAFGSLPSSHVISGEAMTNLVEPIELPGPRQRRRRPRAHEGEMVLHGDLIGVLAGRSDHHRPGPPIDIRSGPGVNEGADVRVFAPQVAKLRRVVSERAPATTALPTRTIDKVAIRRIPSRFPRPRRSTSDRSLGGRVPSSASTSSRNRRFKSSCITFLQIHSQAFARPRQVRLDGSVADSHRFGDRMQGQIGHIEEDGGLTLPDGQSPQSPQKIDAPMCVVRTLFSSTGTRDLAASRNLRRSTLRAVVVTQPPAHSCRLNRRHRAKARANASWVASVAASRSPEKAKAESRTRSNSAA